MNEEIFETALKKPVWIRAHASKQKFVHGIGRET